jgi:type II secretory pathway component PulF
MPYYFYKAKSLDGEINMGIQEAKSVRELAQILKNDGLILVKADVKREAGKNILAFHFFLARFLYQKKC